MATGILTFSKRMDLLARFCLVYFLLIAFLMLDLISFDVNWFKEMRPSFALMALFYWSIFRPSLIPVWLVFLLGLLIDLVSGLPIGMNTLVFVIICSIIQSQRKLLMGQPFFTVYFGFIVFSIVAGLMQWAIFSLVNLTWIDYYPLIGAMIMSAAFFPIAFLMMHGVHKILPTDL